MIRPEKISNALYALQGILIHARAMASRGAAGKELADLLDIAEVLPQFMASKTDMTDEFRQYIAEISNKHGCPFILQYFDNPTPPEWVST